MHPSSTAISLVVLHLAGVGISGLLSVLAKQGIPLELFRAGQRPILVAHNRQEIPLLAKSIERHALRCHEAVIA